MGGLAILLFIGLYIAVSVWVVKRQKSMRAKLIALVIALLIPSADAILGRIYLQHLCDTEGGLKVYRVVEGVEGFMVQGGTDGYWVKNYGYQFSEGKTSTGKFYRFSRQNGGVVVDENVVPKSQYLVRYVGKSGIYSKAVDQVEAIANKEVLARYTSLAFSGGWAERFLAQFSDAGVGNVAFCKKKLRIAHDGRVQAVLNSLLPKKGNVDVNN